MPAATVEDQRPQYRIDDERARVDPRQTAARGVPDVRRIRFQVSPPPAPAGFPGVGICQEGATRYVHVARWPGGGSCQTSFLFKARSCDMRHIWLLRVG